MSESAAVRKQVAGSLKEAIGKVTGDAVVQEEGATEKKQGQAQGDATPAAGKRSRGRTRTSTKDERSHP